MGLSSTAAFSVILELFVQRWQHKTVDVASSEFSIVWEEEEAKVFKSQLYNLLFDFGQNV